jgi:hypothetical protein
VEKYSTAGQAKDDNMAHAHCMLDTQGYKDTFRTCNSYCFSAAIIVGQMRHNVKFVCILSLMLILVTTKY